MNLVRITLLLYFTLIYSQVGIQVTQTSNFANGEQLNYPFPITPTDTTGYIINENLFDISTTYKNFYLYTQLEYSAPPVFGETRTTVDNILNTYYLEYLGERISVKLGDIYSVHARGLLFNTYQEQSTDFNNSIRGLEFSYSVKDWLRIYSLYGTDTYEFRTRPDNQLNDLSFDHTTMFMGSEIYPTNDITINIQYQNQLLNISESNTTYGGANTIEYYSNLLTVLGRDIAENISAFSSDGIDQYNINSDMLGLSLQGYLLGVDFYGEYASNKYTKLQPGVKFGERVDGSLFYTSLYADILGNGVTYEFKRYDTPYFIPTVSFGPIVYRQATSTLQSKVTHNMNFVNEVGHQLDVIHMIGDNINLNFNLSIARRIHPFDGEINSTINVFDSTAFDSDVINNGLYATLENIDDGYWESTSMSQYYGYSNPNIMSILFMDKDEEVFSFWPYRQLYTGISGDLLDDRLYFSIGYDLFDHIKQWGGEYELGMTHNNYTYSGHESAQTIINDYWLTESASWDTTSYWFNFDLHFTYINEDSTEAHQYAEEQAGFSLDDYYNIDGLINESQQIASNSLDSISSNSNNYQWHYDSEKATTIPMSFAWTFENGNSMLVYFEQQWREKELNQDRTYYSGDMISSGTKLEKANEQYLSLTYKNQKYGTFTVSLNQEKNTTTTDTLIVKNKQWNGFQWTYNFHNKSDPTNNALTPIKKYLLGNSRVSIFYGSQRGGLICANGVCAMQPEFLNGIKLNYIRML